MVTALINPMGSPDAMPVQEAYQQEAFFKGFTEGYNTMDALASLAFWYHRHSNITQSWIQKIQKM